MTLVVDNSAPSAPAAPRRRRTYRRRYTRRYGGYRRGYRRFRSYRPRRRYGRYNMRGRMATQGLPKFVAAQIDPFNVACDGVKIPDSNTYPSTSLRVEDSISGSTDANGLMAKAFIPHPTNIAVTHTAVGASNWIWPAGWAGTTSSSRQSALAAAYGLHRTCAHGVRVSCSGAPTSITGNVHVAIIATSGYGTTTWNFPTTISELSNAMFYKKYPLAALTQQPLTIVNKFLDCTSTRYLDISSDGISAATSDVTFQQNGFGTIIVVVEGAPVSTTLLSIESVMHIEAIPLANSVDNGSPAAPFNVNTLQSVSRMAGETPGAYTQAEEQSYFDQVSQALSQGIHAGSNYLFQNVVAPAAYHAGVAGTMYAARQFGLPGITNFRNPSAFATQGYLT